MPYCRSAIKGVLSVSRDSCRGVIFGFEPLRRPFDLHHANLSNQWLLGDNPQSDPADANSVYALITTGAWNPDSGVQTVEDAGPPARQPESSNLGERFIERGNAAAVHVGLYLD